MPCSPRCKYIPPLLMDWPPTPNEALLWKTIATGICPPMRLVDPTPGEFSLYKKLELICAGAEPGDVAALPCGSSGADPFGFTEEVGRQVAKQKGLTGFGIGSVVTFSAFGPKRSDGFSLSSRNVDNMCEQTESPGGDTAGSILLPALAIECEQTIDGADWTRGGCAVMDCEDASPHLNYRAVNGLPPYTWSIVSPDAAADLVLTPSGGNNTTVIVEPPSNTVAGVAYIKVWGCCAIGWNGSICTGSGAIFTLNFKSFGCEDEVEVNCNASAGGATCNVMDGGCGTNTYCGISACGGPGALCDSGTDLKETCDKRTAGMKSSGCCPCALCVDGAVLTVTDVAGQQVSVTVGIQ